MRYGSGSKVLSWFTVLLLLTIGVNASEAPRKTLSITIDMPSDSLKIMPEGESFRVQMKGTALLGQAGCPDLLLSSHNVILPPGMAAEKLAVTDEHWEVVPGKYHIAPTIPPQPVTTSFGPPAGGPAPHADAAVYSSTTPYPGWTARLSGSGTMRGASVARLEIAPLRWTPSTGVLEVLTRVDLQIGLQPCDFSSRAPAAPRTARDLEREVRFIERNVFNPEMVREFLPARTTDDTLDPPIYQPGWPTPEYLIIASDADGLMKECEALEQWLTKSGQPADLIQLEWVLANYGQGTGGTPQTDDPEKVRLFIVEAYENYGIEYVLLVGDLEQMPTRMFRSCYAENPEYWPMPTDFYYSDLDGSHNMDGDEYWFERYDDYPAGYEFFEDVYVGRVPAKTNQMVIDYLDKWFSYINAYEDDWQTNVLYAGADVYGCNSTVTMFENLVDPIVNNPPIDVTKLYCGEWPEIPEWQPLSIDSFIAEVSRGQALILHAAHSGYWCLGMEDGCFQNGIYGTDHIEMLTNLDRYGVMYSLGCSVQPWDYDHAMGEDLAVRPEKAMIASVANSDVGWWPTQMYNLRDFAESAIGNSVVPVAQNMIDAKQTSIWYQNYNPTENFWTPWGKCSVNLLGEPSLAVWTALPRSLTLSKQVLYQDGGQWQVTITVGEVNVVPTYVEGARVCLSRGSVYEVGYTNALGKVTFTISGSSSRVLDCVATAVNHRPAETTVLLRSYHIEPVEFMME